MIHVIAAIDRRLSIGHGNQLLFRLPDDMRRFRLLTTGHTVLMGRKTFQSLPKGALPNRRNLVVSRQGFRAPSAEVFASLADALDASTDEEVYIIGGASVYQQTIALADALHLTEVDAIAPLADAYFPHIDPDVWTEVGREHHPADGRHAVAFDFVDYVRQGKASDAFPAVHGSSFSID